MNEVEDEDEDNDEVWNKGKVLFRVAIEYRGGRRPRKLLLGAIPIKYKEEEEKEIINDKNVWWWWWWLFCIPNMNLNNLPERKKMRRELKVIPGRNLCRKENENYSDVW